ncbi:hypothetical protein FA95DRAFT_1603372 [Auriscalpium vulgare]|uniref:Uncharacterized protein n=1 Tax=Auriscalpium vulgare TaxID=40419 RepID=A0ACB8S1X4_9AGAM|nr:hypothetical protein FA95DRAFT_1603372 [Auriscalpium vulgare]
MQNPFLSEDEDEWLPKDHHPLRFQNDIPTTPENFNHGFPDLLYSIFRRRSPNEHPVPEQSFPNDNHVERSYNRLQQQCDASFGERLSEVDARFTTSEAGVVRVGLNLDNRLTAYETELAAIGYSVITKLEEAEKKYYRRVLRAETCSLEVWGRVDLKLAQMMENVERKAEEATEKMLEDLMKRVEGMETQIVRTKEELRRERVKSALACEELGRRVDRAEAKQRKSEAALKKLRKEIDERERGYPAKKRDMATATMRKNRTRDGNWGHCQKVTGP